LKSCPTYSSVRSMRFCQADSGKVMKDYPWRYKLQQCTVCHTAV
jgi:hypothetical protein